MSSEAAFIELEFGNLLQEDGKNSLASFGT